jgi:hypothetical protein
MNLFSSRLGVNFLLPLLPVVLTLHLSLFFRLFLC